MNAADLTDIDRREVYLWIVLGRYEEAIYRGDAAATDRLWRAFKRRLADYEAACHA